MDLKWFFFDGLDGSCVNAENFEEIPCEIAGIRAEEITFCEDVFEGRSSFADAPAHGVFFSEFEVEEETVLPMGFGGNYFYQVFLNGRSLLDRRESGNKPYYPPGAENFIVPGCCRKGKNLLTVVIHSGQGAPVALAFRIMKDHPWEKTVPSLENYAALLDGKYPAEGTPERKYACELVQNGVLMMRNTVFNPFALDGRMEKEKTAALEKEYPILYFYEKAFDRVLEEVSSHTPGEEEVFLWLIYNMGYVIKSPAGCFGLDLNHRRAAELAPLLDFVLTTHNHIDHFDAELFKAMTAQQKSVVSNFHPAPGFHRPPQELQFGEITIQTQENDHNPTLKKFVTSYYITLPNGCSIFASGDSRNVEQLDPPCGKVDIFIPHPRVGLYVPDAVEKFRPKSVLYSHLLEMRHTPPTPWYAVPYDLLDDERKLVSETGTSALAPLWGEKLVWDTGEKRFI